MEDSKLLGDVDLDALFDEIITKTEQREGFQDVKEISIGFSAIEDMKALREEFVAAETELELWFALVKLSNARRDRHLQIIPIDGGLPPPERRPLVCTPIRVLPEIQDVHNPTFFVASVEEGVASPEVGDVIVRVNGRTMKEYINEAAPLMRHSTLPFLYWRGAAQCLPRQHSRYPSSFYSERVHLTLERPSGQRYDVALPYGDDCPSFSQLLRLTDPYSGFEEVIVRQNFRLRLDRERELILLDWRDFEMDDLALVNDVDDLMKYAEKEQILDWDMVIDVTYSGGGSGGAFVIQRLVDRPFRTTFSRTRLSDAGKDLVEKWANRRPRAGAPDIFGFNLSNRWRIDWARSDAKEAIERGDEWTKPVPLRLEHLPKDSDGFLQPAPVHFTGRKVLINGRTMSGSHQDQFVAMLVDNDLVTFLGVPTGGYSNPWEHEEDLYFPGTSQPVVRFMWTISHTLRPNGEVLEGNPAQPDVYIPITRENYRDYHKMLLDAAIDTLNP